MQTEEQSGYIRETIRFIQELDDPQILGFYRYTTGEDSLSNLIPARAIEKRDGTPPTH